MTSATVAKTAKTGVQAQAKPEKIRRDHKVNWWLTAVVTVLSLTVLVPLYFAVVTALKTPGEAGTFSLPTTWEWHNFADAWNKVNYPKAALNSDHHRVRGGVDAADEHVRRVCCGTKYG